MNYGKILVVNGGGREVFIYSNTMSDGLTSIHLSYGLG